MKPLRKFTVKIISFKHGEITGSNSLYMYYPLLIVKLPLVCACQTPLKKLMI